MQKQVIEFNGEAVGALMPDDHGLRFIAVKYGVWSLDGRRFSHPSEAWRAVKVLLSKPAGRSMPPASFWVPGEGDPSPGQFRWNAVSAIPSPLKENRA
ncbi:hypothetical protein OE766_10370 [Pararhizobium sp. YC-54]|uniref:hypothetical protein n=1 Tax=Pararhizobium sp. YC-54 TaxID=2986920 RepID=UPI0021F7689B|nr:hypothetical protein [Pararhizobium sp. YC-54]MCV9998652.1 hypothetical protein [Pararhizobium sp. YC-54]